MNIQLAEEIKSLQVVQACQRSSHFILLCHLTEINIGIFNLNGGY